MNDQIKQLYTAATEARTKLHIGVISYEEARAIVEEYIKHANKKGEEIAKRFGKKYRPLDAKGFLR